MNRSGHPPELADVIYQTAAALSLQAKDSGKLIVAAVADLVASLPAVTKDMRGVTFEFFVSTLSSSTGLSISPDANDKIMGKGITAADDKDYVNTAASDAVGDYLRIVCDGVDGWLVTNERGTWALES